MSIGPFWVGDIPSQSFVFDIDRAYDAADLSTFTGVEMTVIDPAGVEVPVLQNATIVDDTIVADIAVASGSPYDLPGIYTVQFALTSPTAREATSAMRFIVQERSDWYDLATARGEWRDAPADDVILYQLLWVAQGQVLQYAPALAVDEDLPVNYRHAQLVQARNLWNAGKVDPAQGEFGADSFVLTPRPLDWIVKQIIRPKRGVPVVG